MPIAAALPYIAAATAVAGTVSTLSGANKQSKDQAHTDDLNRAAVKEADLSQWQSYLMQRGLNPQGVTQFGDVPTNAAPVNTKLPLWAEMTFNKPDAEVAATKSMVRRRPRA